MSQNSIDAAPSGIFRPSKPRFPRVIRLKSLNFSWHCFVAAGRRNNSAVRRNHFPFWRRYPETAVGYQTANETAGAARTQTRGNQKRTNHFVLPLPLLLAGPPLAGCSGQSLARPGPLSLPTAPLTLP